MDRPLERRLAGGALAGAGVAAGVGQVVLVRELLNIAAGNELTIGIMLAGWFLWGAMGAGLVGRLATLDETLNRSRQRVIRLALYPVFAIMLGIGFARLTPMLLSTVLPIGLGAQPGEVMGLPQLVVVTLLTIMGAGALAGAQFAAGLKLYTQLDETPRAVGLGYACDALGHLTGGVLAAVLLVWGVNAQTMALVGGLAALWTGKALWTQHEAVRLRPKSIYLMLALVIAESAAAFACARVTMPPAALARREHTITERQSPYGSWAVTRFGQSGVYYYLDGAPVGCSPATPGIQYLVHFPLLQTPSPQRVLLIGGGANGALAQVLQYPVKVDYAELDPTLISLVQRYSVAEDRVPAGERVSVHATDGRRWLRLAKARHQVYDAVIVALPDPGTAQLNRFYTTDFFRQVAALLKPEGVVGLQIPSSDTYFGDELLRLNAVLLRTVQSVFPQVALLPGDPLVIAVSRSGRLSEDPAVLRARYDKFGLQATDFRAHVADRLFPLTLQQVRDDLDKAPPVPLNTDQRPIGYFYDQAYWVAQHSRGSWAVFRAIAGLRLRPALLTVLTMLSVALLGRLLWRPERNPYVPLAILATGGLAMVLELVLLFSFQVQYGYVYQLIGVLTGAFMVGLAAGGIAAAGVAARAGESGCRRLLMGLQITIALLAVLLPQALQAISALSLWPAGDVLLPYLVFPLLFALVGLVVGAEFPLAARSCLAPSAAQSGARLYAADLLGAALGALIAGAALVPVLGINETCYLAGAVSAAVAILLAL